MPRLFIGNFDFEHRLADPRQQRLPESVERINEELAMVWIAIAEADDRIKVPANIETEFLDELAGRFGTQAKPVTKFDSVGHDSQIIPWGWTEGIRQFAKEHDWNIDSPEQEIVRVANSRSFSFQLEQEFKCGLDGAERICSLNQLQELISGLPSNSKNEESAAYSSKWVIKAAFSNSARERILGQGTQLSEQHENWILKRLRESCAVYFEPWVGLIEEAGIQLTVPKTGSPIVEGVTPLLTDQNGHYCGNRLGDESDLDHWSAAIEISVRAADRLQELGYFGPLGIDATRYRDQTEMICYRPLQDINARYTMGRLAMGWRRLLQPGQIGAWLHVRWLSEHELPQAWYEHIKSRLPSETQIFRTSPFEIKNRPTRLGTILVIAESAVALTECERIVFSTD